ncbi:HpcH/HpaI aldolase/citrate lyase family protein [Paenibacillus sp. MMS18-CY102]|uniref:HpcH/HpaI aldolase/citrate lyase family protein n=1 Tax=Paenibacillus sp. MMS18-CY102 TaxID=2682849 RepID=UPI001365E350|nr:HpcH/HpaI aldolase/citrate lyase family protein [Paenibacillus sp. MMS18-CY102]MWC27823.1 citrate lyase subunit beta [Paenibacillus sp. MMS18-CY102]
MRYFNELSEDELQAVFYSPPGSFTNRSPQELLAYAVGAALYMPATRTTIASDITTGKLESLVTAVIDLEDAVGDNEVEAAERSAVQQLSRIAFAIESGMMPLERLPLLFVRVRSADQLERFIEELGHSAHVLTGFVFPKFTVANGERYFRLLERYNCARTAGEPPLYGMPVLESASIIYKESRLESLLGIKRLLDYYRPYVLNVRIGATDFSSLFGLRRSPDSTVYDIAAIRDCIGDIINVFGRAEDGYVISGPVWEYFASSPNRLPLASLRDSRLREALLPELELSPALLQGRREASGNGQFEREIMLDKENGIIGKTVIHPSHIRAVQAIYAVTHEEYTDAYAIIAGSDGSLGVMKSEYSNKMNEMKPHYNWARRIIARAKIYGVLHEQQRYSALFREQDYARL